MGFMFHVSMFGGVTILQRMHCRGITCHCFFAIVPQVVICPVPAVVVDLLVVLRPYWGVDSLDGLVHSLIRGGVADSTLRSYAVGKRRYLDFCFRFGFRPLPVCEVTLLRFGGSLGRTGSVSPDSAVVP